VLGVASCEDRNRCAEDRRQRHRDERAEDLGDDGAKLPAYRT
jgi:hypothetical protein